ncbi:F-type H+-transporting ATPase subunit b [Mycoplasmoides fastidiosum]|uniref:ATP synthase subunit b n=1 Tax=Mycoplasmoides fastidiosum TaxID=92758 RepID=A0ABU0LYL9_9BACT|nr:hypothetical protein [Mycoplasmoides fastidiosum]MDQ0513767.1 F-type H+-transporting ATPase subunit b [Mycoplasmoides fastidiosum]UUD37813.1 hypothetical protein NPA10_00230 [Mycoplasmoides fastidiosum]
MQNFLPNLLQQAQATIMAEQNESVLGGDNFFKQIIPNVWILVAHIFSAIVVISVIIFLIWRPTRMYMERRRKLLNENIESADRDRNEAAQNLAEIKKERLETQKTISDLLYQSKKDAEEITNKTLTEANNKAKLIHEDALRQAEQIKKSTQQDLKDEVSTLALAIASKIISKDANNEANQKFVDEYLDSLN